MLVVADQLLEKALHDERRAGFSGVHPGRKEDDFVTTLVSNGKERDAAAVVGLAEGADADMGLKLGD